MTAPSIIEDGQARELAHGLAFYFESDWTDDGDRFRRSGGITRWLINDLEFKAEADDPHAEVVALFAYVSHHGERGPQTGGYVVTVTPKGVHFDSAGNAAVNVPVEDIQPGTAIYGGFKPHPVVASIEHSGGVECRMVFEDGRRGGWITRGAPVATVAEVERHPVDTLEQAREEAQRLLYATPHKCVKHDWQDCPHDAFLGAAMDIPAEGGTVGPLPDGTVISVERVPDWSER